MYSLFAVNILLMFIVQNVCSSFINPYPEIKSERLDGDAGEPLILTPLIEQNKIKEAQNASKVTFSDFQNVVSYSGFLTVNKDFNSNMFFWFFPSESNYLEDPVIVWLQGGPGASNMLGIFIENGPFYIAGENSLMFRQYSLTKKHSVIYIDNPVGAGYGFTDDGGYAKNDTQVANYLYEALIQFFQLFPELQKNKFFVGGGSYGGKFIPATSYTIHQNNPTAKIKINLQGLIIGSGFCDPVNQLNYSDFMYQVGLIDLNTKNVFKETENQIITLIKNEQYLEAYNIYINYVEGPMFQNATGFSSYYSILVPEASSALLYLINYVQRADVRAAIHVGNLNYNFTSETIGKKLSEDYLRSVAPLISELLNNYRVLFFNGQLDIKGAYPLTLNFLQNLQFSGADEYKTNPRNKWYVNGVLAGYKRYAGKLTEVMVRNAGHLVPGDQPEWASDFTTNFTYYEV